MPVTLKDIAERVGVSITTVSRALNGYSDVSTETRERVKRAAQDMGYYPDVRAQQLRKRRTDTLGFVIPTARAQFSDPFFTEFLAGIGTEASEHDYDLLVSAVPPGPEEEHTYRRLVLGRRVDGLILARTRRQDDRIHFLAEQDMPFVCFGRSELDIDFPYVDVDGAGGIQTIVSHLVDLGHRRIACVAPPRNLMFAAHRIEGYRRGLQAHGLPYDERLVREGDLTHQAGYTGTQALLDLVPAPTALICCNDHMALGAMNAVRERGLSVGTDVAVTGFDNIPLAEHANPPLTTMHQPILEIGERVCRMLLGLLDGEDLAERHALLKPDLIVRKSSLGERR